MSIKTFVYKSNNSNYEEIFKNGICFYNSEYSFNSSFYEVEDIYSYITENINQKAIYFVEIPEEYLKVIKKDSKIILPYPILFEKVDFDDRKNIFDIYPILVPRLIKGVYIKDEGVYLNENYNPKYNPNGIKYTKEQLDQIRISLDNNVYNKFNERNVNYTCEELYRIDGLNPWDDLIEYYNICTSTQPFVGNDLPTVSSKPSKTKCKKNNKKKKNKAS